MKLDNKNLSLFSNKAETPTPSLIPKKPLSVSELTERIKTMLENAIGSVWVTGEVSNLRQPVSGHLYFSLKDESSQIRCVLFDSTRRVLKFQIENGMETIILGKVSVYKKSGDYQIIVDAAEPKGIGALQVAFEQLKRKLESEGLFDASRKKPLPFLPGTIGIVTSLSGAALQDILNIIDRRFPTVHIIVYPVKVQGAGAKEEIAQAIDDFSQLPFPPDVLIVGRGGGSIEDLWAFNEEIVARAISHSQIPIISAVGHEIDYTIADLVADRRAPTPSAAAEIVLPIKEELTDTLAHLRQKLVISLQHQTEMAQGKLDALRKSFGWQAPINRIREYYQRMDELTTRLSGYIKQNMEKSGLALAEKVARLNALSPLNILARGYSITYTGNKQILKSVKQIKAGDDILTKLADGEIKSTVN
ncbi:MAG: exodeoxyribonuclease VII large subunit [Planctomycetes bacterium]|nr:exodeoxyribonuclease VII large subunit [Planctomycetota bacterium]